MGQQTRSPWDDWIPGVLHRGQIRQLNEGGLISTENPKGLDIGVCSIDLSLSPQVFEMKKGSIKPSREYRYREILENTDLAKSLQPDALGSYHLRRQQTYVIRLHEKLDTSLGSMGIYGQAT